MNPAVSVTTPVATNLNVGSSKQGTTSESMTSVDGSFGNLIGEIMEETDRSKPEDSNLLFAEMLQALIPIQNVLSQQANQQQIQPTETVESLVQALNSKTPLAELIVQSDEVQDWLQEALAVLPEVVKQALANMNTQQSGTEVGKSEPNLSINLQQAQLIVKQFAEVMGQGTDQPEVALIASKLNNAVQPFQELLSLFKSNEGMNQLQSQQPVVSEVQTNFVGVGLKPRTSQADVSKELNKALNSVGLKLDQSVVSKLGMLAAKAGVPIMEWKTIAEEVTVNQEDLMEFDLPGAQTTMVINDLLKQAQGDSLAVKAATPMIQAEQFSEEMTAFVMKNFKVTLADGTTETKMSLFPQHLGHVDVKLTMHNGHLTAQFSADTLAGKEMLESQLPQLRVALQAQGIQVERMEVTQNHGFDSTSMFQDQRRQGSGQPQKQGKGNQSGQMVGVAEETEAAKQTGWNSALHGVAIDTTA